ncbi:MAG TPA: Holliday junction branch migration protein RuvA [bacterium]|nr:Holliday junction branch migration protein RuvA [bacterium]
MISYLKGKSVLFKWGLLILDVGGVGYRINVPPQIHLPNNIVQTQAIIELFIHHHIREDAQDLYGFLTFEELELFEKLISVNGVGPKAGLSIMSAGKSEDIIRAIQSDNTAFFTAISGIGKKVAAKIILDLKSKLSGIGGDDFFGAIIDSDETLEALLSLGYKGSEVQGVLAKLPAELKTTEEKVRWCLKNL